MNNRELRISFSLLLFTMSSLILVSCRDRDQGTAERTEVPDYKAVVIVDNQAERGVDIYIDGEVFTSYIYPEDLMKPVLFPVRSAAGTVITRGFPLDPRAGERIDHPHQVGIWFNYGDVNGYDFWNNSHAIPPERKQEMGRIIHRGVKKAESRDHIGVLEVAMDWQINRDNGSSFTILQEKTIFMFSGNEQIRQIDRITRLTAQEEDILFRDNKEGLFAIRLDRAFEYPTDRPLILTDDEGKVSEVEVLDNEGVNGHYRNSQGVEDLEAWAKRADWVRLNSTVGQEKITVAIMDHKNNPGYPAYWHARGYGLFSVNNLGQAIFSEGKEQLNYRLTAGESVTFMHRMYITSGYWASDDELNRVFEEFNHN